MRGQRRPRARKGAIAKLKATDYQNSQNQNNLIMAGKVVDWDRRHVPFKFPFY
jgi:hypothetical protein